MYRICERKKHIREKRITEINKILRLQIGITGKAETTMITIVDRWALQQILRAYAEPGFPNFYLTMRNHALLSLNEKKNQVDKRSNVSREQDKQFRKNVKNRDEMNVWK